MIIEKIRQADAYVTGKDHIRKNTECQDRTFYYKANGTHVIALSDGAGSRPKSQYGAEVVTEEVSKYVAKNFINLIVLTEKRGKEINEYEENILKVKSNILNIVKSSLNEFCLKNDGLQINDLSCTLELVAVKNNQYFAIHIGDGVIGLLKNESGEERLSVLSTPENGGAPNITFFITDDNAIEHLRIYSGSIENIKGFILMSDGPEEALYNEDNGLSSNALLLFKGLNGNTINDYKIFLENLLKEKISQVSYDDLSVNILYMDVIDTNDKYEDKYLKDILDNISNNQIITQSRYSVLIDDSIEPDNDFLDYNERLTELKRKYDR